MTKPRRSRGSSSKRTSGKTAQMMRQLVESENTQLKSTIPAIEDVPRIHIKPQKVYTIQRSALDSSIVASTTVPVANSFAFNLTALPNYTEFTALFDRYRILQVTWTATPTNQNQVSAPLYTVLDYDDASNLSSVSEAMQYPSCVVSQAGALVQRTINPRFAMAAYSGAFTSYAMSKYAQWVNSSSPGVQHYGLKYYLPASGGASASWTVTYTFTIQFTDPI